MKGPRGNNGERSRVLLRRSLLGALALALSAPSIAHAASSGEHARRCVGDPNIVKELELDPVDGEAVTGKYALPATDPKGLVVIFHGYGHDSDAWATPPDWEPTQTQGHLSRIADKNGVVVVAMDYHRTNDSETWQVQEGADDSIAAAHHFEHRCGGFPIVVAYGVSMGGNASGLALASKPKSALDETKPLFDWWFDIEGANNVVETYNEARAVSPSGNDTALTAVTGIEQEMGGSKFESDSQTYLDHTNVYRADDIVASGVKGIVMVHALGDALVPYNQSREMQAAIAGRTPIQFWTVGTAGRSKDTTIDGYVDAAIEDYATVPHDKPLAGHSNESSMESRVSWLGFARLDALFQRGVVPDLSGEFVYDEDTDQYTAPERGPLTAR
jgi:hypothetical protein